MRSIIILLLLILCLPAFACAGEIYGRIREGRSYIGPGIRIEIEYDGGQQSTVTEMFGSYRLYVPKNGKVLFKLYKPTEKEPSTQVIYSFDKPARYDFVLNGNAMIIQ